MFPIRRDCRQIMAMKEYDLYLPLHHNDGRPVEPAKINQIKKLLVDAFGGVTHFPQENDGLWKLGGVTFRDKVVVLRVLADDESGPMKFFAELRVELMRTLEQADVLIVEREVTLVS
jgi:hypothetical protein